MTRPRTSVHNLRWMIRAASEAGKPGWEAPDEPRDTIPAVRGSKTETQENRGRA